MKHLAKILRCKSCKGHFKLIKKGWFGLSEYKHVDHFAAFCQHNGWTFELSWIKRIAYTWRDRL